jgi:hypothetical protein
MTWKYRISNFIGSRSVQVGGGEVIRANAKAKVNSEGGLEAELVNVNELQTVLS